MFASSRYSAPISSRHADDAVDVVDVEPVEHHVQHHRPALVLDELRDPVLQLEGLGVREEVVHLARASPGTTAGRGRGPAAFSAAARCCRQADAGGEQVGVVAQPVRLGDDDLEVVAQQRLAAREAAAARRRARAPSRSTRSQSSVPSSSLVAARSRSGCSRTRSAAGSGRSARPAATAAVRDVGAVLMASVPCQPALLAGDLDEGQHVGLAGPCAANAASSSATIAVDAALAVAALQDLAGAAVELDHAFGVQQHVAVLRRLPLQAKAARRCAAGMVSLSVAHAFTPYFSAIASFIAHRMSSLNCSTSSARSCCGARREVRRA